MAAGLRPLLPVPADRNLRARRHAVLPDLADLRHVRGEHFQQHHLQPLPLEEHRPLVQGIVVRLAVSRLPGIGHCSAGQNAIHATDETDLFNKAHLHRDDSCGGVLFRVLDSEEKVSKRSD